MSKNEFINRSAKEWDQYVSAVRAEGLAQSCFWNEDDEDDEDDASEDLEEDEDTDSRPCWKENNTPGFRWLPITELRQQGFWETNDEECTPADAASCIWREDNQAVWQVAVEHNGETIHFDEHDHRDDALAYAIEAIRCLRPNAVFSKTEIAHRHRTNSRKAVMEDVGESITNLYRWQNIKPIPPRAQAIYALRRLRNNFKLNKRRLWELRQHEEDATIPPQDLLLALEVEKEIVELLDTVWFEA